jgi:O-antigen ligase
VSSPSIESTAFLSSRVPGPGSARTTVAGWLDFGLFYALLLVMVLVAIPYGAAEPWWQAAFQCLVFVLASIAVIERWLRPPLTKQGSIRSSLGQGSGKMILPLLALIVFALVQIIPWRGTIAGVNAQWTMSWDPLSTKTFIVQVCALILFGWMLVRYTLSERRLLFLVDTIVAIGFVSATFGLLRQATQQQIGFVLPQLKPGFGYAQFINSNHFAYLMEMALGLSLGMVVTGSLVRRRLILFLLASLLMWVAVVRVNSRGGLVSMLAQVVLLGVFALSNRGVGNNKERPLSLMKQWTLSVTLILVLLAASLMTIIFVGGDPLAQRIGALSVEMNQKTAQTYTLRQNIWQATWALIKEHPVAGVGFGGYWVAISQYHRASGDTTPQQAHNDYLELMASGGAIALGIGIWFVIVFAGLARRAFGSPKHLGRGVAVGAIVGIITVSIHSFVDFGLHVPINALVCTTLIMLVAIVEKGFGPSRAQAILNRG